MLSSLLWVLVLLALISFPFFPNVKYPVRESSSQQAFERSEELNLMVDVLQSKPTQRPKDFYSLPFPKPEAGVKGTAKNLGEALGGKYIHNTDFKLKMMEDEYCKVMGRTMVSKLDALAFKGAIEQDYRVRWFVPHSLNIDTLGLVKSCGHCGLNYHHSINRVLDNLPSAAAINNEEKKIQTTVYSTGHPIGTLR